MKLVNDFVILRRKQIARETLSIKKESDNIHEQLRRRRLSYSSQGREAVRELQGSGFIKVKLAIVGSGLPHRRTYHRSFHH